MLSKKFDTRINGILRRTKKEDLLRIRDKIDFFLDLPEAEKRLKIALDAPIKDEYLVELLNSFHKQMNENLKISREYSEERTWKNALDDFFACRSDLKKD